MGSPASETQDPLVFGTFEFDPATLELKRNGSSVRLQEMPARILYALLRNPGQVITREDLHAELWPSDTFVQFDAGLNTAMNKLRFALRDSASNPRYIETVPRTGYRFIESVQRMNVRVMPMPELVPEVPPAPVTSETRKRSWKLLAACAVLVLAAAAIILVAPFRRTPRNHAVRFAIDLPDGQEFQFYSGRAVAISPDGATIAWIAATNGIRQIYVRKLDDTAFRPIPSTEGASSLCFSPKGDWLAFAQEGQLAKASLDGRANTRLLALDRKSSAISLLWGADDWVYFSAGNYSGNPNLDTRPLFRVHAAGGQPERVLAGQPTVGYWYPQQWLDRGLLYSVDYAPSDLAIEFTPWKSTQSTTIVKHASGGRLLPTGQLIFAQSGNLMAVPFDRGRMQPAGTPAMVVPDVAPDRYAGLQMDLSETGTLVYLRSTLTHERQPVWVDLEGHESSAPLPPGRYHLLELSPDGRNLLLTRYDAGDHWTIYSFQMDTLAWKEILSGDSPNTAGIWSPDGRSLAVAGRYQGERFETLYLKPFDTAGGERPLLSDSYSGKFPQSWSSAANALLYADGFHETTKRDIYVLPMTAGAKPRCIACTPEDDIFPSFSRDARWITYASRESGRLEIYARRYPEDAPAMRVTSNGGQASLWAPSGRELYYWNGEEMWAMAFDAETGKTGSARKLFEGNYDVGSIYWNRDLLLSTDGTRFLMLKKKNDPPDYRRIQVVLNWFDELKQQ